MTTYIKTIAHQTGKKIVDAKKHITIEVTEEDSKRAVPGNSKSCAFARACRRMNGIEAAYFFLTSAWLEHKDKLVRYSLPPSMTAEIKTFDRGGKMAAGTYELSPAYRTRAELKARNERRKSRKWRKSKAKRPVHRTTLVRSTQEPKFIDTGR